MGYHRWMITRVLAKCSACTEQIVLRITVAGGMQPFLLGCPYCRAEMHGSLDADPEHPFQLKSNDFERVSTEETGTELAVPVNTDLPVRLSLVGQSADEAIMSPFIQATMVIGDDETADLMARIDRMRQLEESIFPYIRRAASYFSRRDLGNLKQSLASAPGGGEIDFSRSDPVAVLGSGLAQLYAPIDSNTSREDAVIEWLTTIKRARERNDQEFRSVYEELTAGPLGRHQARALDTSIAILRDTTALFPAMWAERMESKCDINEYRVMRDDFDILKVRYQDIFELASRTLAFTSRVANVAYRGSSSEYTDGKNRTFNKALNKTTAFNREPWLSDFPIAAKMYRSMQRRVRNDIGHRLVKYDFESGKLIYEDGSSENYLGFLIGYLGAARLSHYILNVCEILWHLRETLSES